jgi:hypothetical protein
VKVLDLGLARVRVVRTGVARIADSITVAVGLGRVRDVRAVVLIRDAEPGTVFFVDPGECKAGGGVWRGPILPR